MIKLYLLSKKIHRVLVIAISLMILFMEITGFFLKYSSVANIFSVDLRLARYLHNSLSPFFSIILVLMALSGIIMYLFPFLRKK